jgi:ribose transport system permease protein
MATKASTDSVASGGSLVRNIREQGLSGARFAAVLLVLFVIINATLNPARFAPAALGTTLGLAAPLILVAIASTPVILAGRGGMDISVGPLMGLVNVLIVYLVMGKFGQTSPLIVIPVALAIGALSGVFNGFLANIVHIQPIVATLGTYLIYSGLAVWIMPTPGGTIPQWLARLSTSAWSVLPILVVVLCWWAMTRTPYYEHLMATGGDDRAAYTSGVHVTAVRMLAYILTGVLAGVAGIALTSLLGSADSKVGPSYTLTAIAAVALGGVSLAGGEGGIGAAILGALDIFLLQSILTYFNISSFALQIAYGVILVFAVTISSPQVRAWLRRGRGGTEHA